MKKVCIAFLAGVTLGILYAPHRGSKTRGKLANLGNDIKEGWNAITDSIIDRLDNVKDGVNSIANSTIETIENAQFETVSNNEPNGEPFV